jgi:hypothetical protein
MSRFTLPAGLVVLALGVGAPASASTITFQAVMSGLNEVPSNASTASGFVTVTLDNVLNSLTVSLTFSGLTNTATAGHIHCCAPAGVNAIVAVPFTGLPAALSGTYFQTFDLTSSGSYNSAFITANGGTVALAEAALIAAMNTGQTYANIHDSPNFPGGEIRGQLAAVPEPATLTLVALGLAALRARRR